MQDPHFLQHFHQGPLVPREHQTGGNIGQMIEVGGLVEGVGLQQGAQVAASHPGRPEMANEGLDL